MRIGLPRRRRRPSAIGWYVRIGIYVAFFGVVLYLMNGLRGRIPQAFGLTPIRVDALSITQVPEANGPASERDYAVTVRIIGRDSVATPILLGQFTLETSDGRYRPYASDLVFADAGTLRVAPRDTLRGVLLFTVPTRETPKELWWNP